MTVSIIVAAHNAEAFIADALRSAVEQTYAEIEVIVVDDGSDDGTAGIVHEFSRRDGRVILLQHERCRGVSAARNTAIRRATGRWLAILDADDEFSRDRLERMVPRAERDRLDLLADNLEKVDFQTKKSLGLAFPVELMAQTDVLSLQGMLERDWPGRLEHSPFGFVKPLIRRAFLDDNGITYAEDIAVGEDFLFYADALLAEGRFGVMSDALYRYSVRARSASSDTAKSTLQLLEVHRRIAKKYDATPECCSCMFADSDTFFREREHALRYQLFSGHLKERRFSQAAESALSIPPSYMTRRLVTALGRRTAALRG